MFKEEEGKGGTCGWRNLQGRIVRGEVRERAPGLVGHSRDLGFDSECGNKTFGEFHARG